VGTVLTVRTRLAIAAAVLAAIAACSGVRSESDTFATVQEARAAGAIDRGWVPEGLPESATDLRDGHEPSGTHWGRFSFPPDQAEALRAIVGAELTSSVPPCDPPGRFEWWPRMLRTPINLETAHLTGLRFYTSRDGRRTFAINWNQGQGYYWSTR
jgi:hypothetical protein